MCSQRRAIALVLLPHPHLHALAFQAPSRDLPCPPTRHKAAQGGDVCRVDPLVTELLEGPAQSSWVQRRGQGRGSRLQLGRVTAGQSRSARRGVLWCRVRRRRLDWQRAGMLRNIGQGHSIGRTHVRRPNLNMAPQPPEFDSLVRTVSIVH